MKVSLWKTAFFGVIVSLAIVFSSLGAFAADDASKQDGFTAVAGTEQTVIDRREKNNVAVFSGLVVTGLILLVLGALSHIRNIKPNN